MGICIVTSIFPPEIGGPSTYAYELSTRMCSRQEIHVVTYGKPENEAVESPEGRFFVHRVPHRPDLPKVIAFPLRLYRAMCLTVKIVRENNLDIIYIQDTNIAGMPGYMAHKITGKPLILKYVGDWAWELASKKGWTTKFLHDFYESDHYNPVIRIIKMIQTRIAGSSAGVVVPSNYLKGVFQKWSRTEVSIIPNAVNVRKRVDRKHEIRKELHLDGRTLLIVGRLVPWKGIDRIISILPEVIGRYPDLRLVVIGEGPDEERLKEMAVSLGVTGNISFLGRLCRDDVRRYMAASDILLLPSLYEGMSHVILEAMASGIPVIASNVCGNPDTMTHGVTGLLIDPEDPEQLKDSIFRFLDLDPDEKERYVKNAYLQVIKKNSWEEHIEALLKLFDGVRP